MSCSSRNTCITPFVYPPIPNSPTSWFWNIRVGDKLQINNAGPWYTVVGPMTQTAATGNSELFVNVGPPGTQSPWFGLYANGNDVDRLLSRVSCCW